MKTGKTFSQRGSALLVVLGFLSFMIISAVSFAIYMRVERQSSSSYRHAVVGRHILESALYRAMDQVDADVKGANSTPKKFPDHWKAGGRIFTSVSDPNSTEIEKARVLNLEALSFLPASLVNEVRLASLDAEWRRISIGAGANKRDVGRYAYVCVNLSDMFNVNGCTNMVRGVSNLVSIASLFPNSAKAKNFSEKVVEDVYYSTLQDFYACMKDQDFFQGKSSPYMEFLDTGNSELFNYANVENHLLVTDGFAKLPPVRSEAVNVTLNPPSDTGKFYEKIQELFPIEKENVDVGRNVFVTILGEYLSKDDVGINTPYLYPSSKLAPMICQVRLNPVFNPLIIATGSAPEPIVYSLRLVSPVGALMGFQVRVCYPFKNVDPARIQTYTLNVDGFIRVNKNNENANNLKSDVSFDPAKDTPFNGTASITPRAIDGVGAAQMVQDKCYQWVPVNVNIPTVPIPMVNSHGTPLTPGYSSAAQINVALVITSMKVQIGTVVYDSLPESPLPQNLIPKSKLYFQTASVPTTTAGSLLYKWDSLEVADPRFNHFTANWINNTDDPLRAEEGMHQVTKDLLGQDGRDADIFMASSGKQNLQSVGELGFIIRPYKFKEEYGITPVDFATKIALNPNTDDSEAFFRTIRLYDQGAKARDKIYENFYLALDDTGNLPNKANVRVNPLSPVGPIIACAMDRIPYNFSGTGLANDNYTEGVLSSGWDNFVGAWASTFSNAVVISGLNTNLATKFYEFYGDNTMGWYAPKSAADPDPRTAIFTGGFAADAPVYEIDRKMMYAFSLDSMSDRQQLFLYILQSEVAAPLSLAKSRSLAGGRLVAVVWRDPYPQGGAGDYHEQKILFYKQLDN